MGRTSSRGLRAIEKAISEPAARLRPRRSRRKPSTAGAKAMRSSCFHHIAEIAGAYTEPASTTTAATPGLVRRRVSSQATQSSPSMSIPLMTVIARASCCPDSTRVTTESSAARVGVFVHAMSVSG